MSSLPSIPFRPYFGLIDPVLPATAAVLSPSSTSNLRPSPSPFATLRYLSTWSKLLRDCVLNKISPVPRRQPLKIIIAFSVSTLTLDALFPPVASSQPSPELSVFLFSPTTNRETEKWRGKGVACMFHYKECSAASVRNF